MEMWDVKITETLAAAGIMKYPNEVEVQLHLFELDLRDKKLQIKMQKEQIRLQQI